MVAFSRHVLQQDRWPIVDCDKNIDRAVLVRTASRTLLYDAGPGFGAESDSGARVVVPALRGARASKARVAAATSACRIRLSPTRNA